MNQFLLFILTFLAIFASAAARAEPRDLSQCRGIAVRAAIAVAAKTHSDKIEYARSNVENSTTRLGVPFTRYEVELNHCKRGEDDCGTLTYGVNVMRKYPDCKVLKVELSGEE